MNEPTIYDATETKDLGYFSTLPFLHRTQAQREDKKLERQARLHFAILVNTLARISLMALLPSLRINWTALCMS